MKKAFKMPFALLLVFLAVAGIFLFLSADSKTDGKTTVYVTNSGKKYHLDDCTSLSRSKIAVTLEDAARSGYEACGICRPPVLPGGAKSNGISAAQPGRTVTRPDESARTGDTAPAALYRVNVAGLKTSAQADTRRMLRAEVVGHVDGDTVRVRIANPPAELGVVETIRMLGVDTPETVHPSKPVEFFGKEASEYTKARLLNKNVLLAFDWDLRDRYGRLLAYIYTTDGAPGNVGADCFNAALIRDGYGHAYTRFPFQFADEFRALEREAREKKRGLWGK